MNIIILCGGLSTRLGDITKEIPKILLPVAGKTVLDWQLEMVRPLGETHIVLAAGHLADVLKAAVGDEYHGFTFTHVIEEKKLGTGGAIKFAMTHVPHPEQPTLILNGDILAGCDILAMQEALKSGSDGIILGSRVEDASTYGTLKYDDDKHLTEFREKEGIAIPGYINGGIYLFTPQVSAYFPDEDTFSIEYDVFPHMKQLYVYESDDPWIDVGVPDRLEWARQHWHDIHLQRIT